MRLLPLFLLLFSTPSAFAQFEAHEWGTFTSLVGSNGITQDGMYHEDEPLPPFVHGFGATQSNLVSPMPPPQTFPSRPCRNKGCFGQDFFAANVITQKMETPVIYFYSDVARSLNVNVRFPEGVVTETFPAPALTSPSAGNVRQAANGNTTFQVDVLPSKTGNIPFVDAGSIYSHARNVDSNVVRAGTEEEKFIFYRGIGRFQPRISVTSENGGLAIRAPSTADRPSALFVVHVNAFGEGQLTRANFLKNEAILDAEDVANLENHSVAHRNDGIESGAQAKNQLVVALTAAGLNHDEATAMVDTWENGYLKVPGLRLLYILPRAEVNSVLPLTINPAPEKLERVFVGRLEVMLDTEEQAVVNQVLKYRSAFSVIGLGRFAEPKLRRAREVYGDTPGADPAILAVFDGLVSQAEQGAGGGGNVN